MMSLQVIRQNRIRVVATANKPDMTGRRRRGVIRGEWRELSPHVVLARDFHVSAARTIEAQVPEGLAEAEYRWRYGIVHWGQGIFA